MRTILYSSERVSANNWETGVFIGFLLVFAVAAAWYYVANTWNDPERSRSKILLYLIIIVTSVIPPELPMELTMAVNASLVPSFSPGLPDASLLPACPYGCVSGRN